MLKNVCEVRVRYADTDKMKIVYNGKYPEYFEVGRCELLRSIGLPYKNIEEIGYQLPVIELYVKYLKPAYYDDLLAIEARMEQMPGSILKIAYEIRRDENGDICAVGYTTHAFVKQDTLKAVKPPEFFIEKIRKYFEN